MDVSKDKSKELLSVITQINKLAHNGFRKKNMPNREFMLLKTIKYLKNSESTNEYSSKGVKASDLK